MDEELSMTRDELIRHGEAIQRLLDDQAVQRLFSALDVMYYKQWKAAETPEARDRAWQQSRALGDLKHGLEAAASVGQHEAASLEREEQLQARTRH